jgi:mRNA interferase MazF
VVDQGYLGKVRPVAVLSIPFLPNERTLFIVVPHTTSVVGTRFEVKLNHSALNARAFDVQQTAAVQAVKFSRRLGILDPKQLLTLEKTLAELLGLKLAPS